jgi:hypothetical protein
MEPQPVGQPLMGQFFKWQTSIAKEDLYNGWWRRKLQGFNRDETYPLGVRFKTLLDKKAGFLLWEETKQRHKDSWQ